MKHSPFRRIGVRTLIMAATLLVAGATRAQATTILDFDNVAIGGGSFDGLYGGADWGTNQWDIGGYGFQPYPSPPGLGPQAIYFQPGGTYSRSFTFLTPQIFQGAWFSGSGTYFDPLNGPVFGTQLAFNLYDSGNNLLHTSGSVTTNSIMDPTTRQYVSGSAQFLSSGYALAVSRVEVAILNAAQIANNSSFIMDGVTFDAPATTPSAVPEPTSLALLAGGLAVLGVSRVRRSRAVRS